METDCWMLPTTPKRAFHLICTVKEAQSLERLSNLLVITQLESTRAWIPAQETWFQNSSKICHIVNIQALPEAPRESLPRLLVTIKAWLMMVVVARHSKVPCLLLLSSVTVATQQSPVRLPPPAGWSSSRSSSFLHLWHHMTIPHSCCSSATSGKPFLTFFHMSPYCVELPKHLGWRTCKPAHTCCPTTSSHLVLSPLLSERSSLTRVGPTSPRHAAHSTTSVEMAFVILSKQQHAWWRSILLL